MTHPPDPRSGSSDGFALRGDPEQASLTDEAIPIPPASREEACQPDKFIPKRVEVTIFVISRLPKVIR